MTEEQKLEALQRILQGANVAQVNLGDGTQNFYVGKEGNTIKGNDAQAMDVEIVESDETTSTKLLCIALNSCQRKILDKAETLNLIKYNKERKGYDVGLQSSKVLVAYLCGRIFCGDYSLNGQWKEGARFEDAHYCTQLFGFDVAGTRRTARGSTGKSPTGYERVDSIFE